MKRIIIFLIVFGTFFGSVNAQKYGMFKGMDKIFLLADTLKAKNTIDFQISKLKNDTSAIRKKPLFGVGWQHYVRPSVFRLVVVRRKSPDFHIEI